MEKAQSVKLPLFLLIISLVLIFSGLGLIFLSSVGHLRDSDSSGKQVFEVRQDKPVMLYIPKIAKTLSIADGEVVGNRWSVSETGVSYLVTSALPGTFGNSVLYGHNRQDILGNLPKVTIGDDIYVVAESGEVIKYEVFERKEIQPTQVEILNDVGDSRLTIYTCSGFLDQARFVVVARLVPQ